MKKIKLFYSSDLSSESKLKKFCLDRNWELIAQSLLQFNPIPFTIQHPFDVVFISSPRSFDYFNSQLKNSKSIHYAVIGKSTAKHVNDLNSSIIFTGEMPGNPQAVAIDFKHWLGEKRVLFPLSTRSQETIANVIPVHQKEIVRCYETELLSVEINPCDIYIFTSPSNVEAFLLKNEIPSSAILIAWGKTTEKKLVELGFESRVVLQQSTEEELVKKLEQLFPD